MIVTDNISLILYVTGAITMATFLQYFLPSFFLKATIGQETEGPAGRFYAQGWGLAVGVLGLMLVYAGAHEEGREAIVMAGLLGKAGFIALILMNWSRHPFVRGHMGALILDTICVVLYGLYLTQTL